MIPAKGTASQTHQSKLFIFLSFVLSCFLLILIVGIAELFFSHVERAPFLKISPPYRQDYPSQSAAPRSGSDPPTHVAIHLPPVRFHNLTDDQIRRFEKERIPVDVQLSPGMNIADAQIGSLGRAGRWRSRAVAPGGVVAYDVFYGIDSSNRRITENSKRGGRAKPLVFFGCSYTFGLGLEDRDTLPSAVARKLKDYRVYNYSYLGWGPNNILRLVSRPGFSQEVKGQNGVAIYAFTDSQMTRIVGNLGLTRMIPNWREFLPLYFLDENGKLQSQGMLAQGRPWETEVHRILARSSILNYFKIDLPTAYRERNFQLFTAILKDIKRVLVKEMGFQDFYVLFYPEQGLAGRLIDELDQAGIKSINYSEVIWPAYAQPSHLPHEEVHPTAAAQEFLAEQILRDLPIR